MSSIEKRISPDIKRIVNELDLYLIDIKYFKENSDFILEIYIDSKGGLTMDQCEEATREINTYLDDKDPIEDQYTLIVSSPGLDRPLKTDTDFYLAIDNELEISFYSSFNGKKKIYGLLDNFDDDYFYITDDNGESLEIERSEVSKITKAIRI